MKSTIEKLGKNAGAILSIIALVTWAVTAISFISAAAMLPAANRQTIEANTVRIAELEDSLALNDEATLSALRFTIGRAHREYTERGYIYRFALEYVLDMHYAASAIRYDAMMNVMVNEIKALPVRAGG